MLIQTGGIRLTLGFCDYQRMESILERTLGSL